MMCASIKYSTKFKRIEVFFLLHEHVSETGKFKGFTEIKEEIDAVKNI